MFCKAALFLSSVVLALASSTAAETETAPQRLSLHDAIALAAKQNPTLAASVAAVRVADATVLATRGVDDLLWETSATWTRNRTDVVTSIPLQQPRVDDVQLSTSLLRLLATGGQVGLRASLDVSSAEYWADPSLNPGVSPYSTTNLVVPSVQLALSQPLLRGAGEAVARAQQRRARLARDAAVLAREAVAAAVVRDVVVAYWDLVMAKEELSIRRALTESTQQQLYAVQANIAVQKLPPSASAEVLVAMAGRQDDAIAAEEALRGQSIELARLVGSLGPADAPALDPVDSPDASPAVPPEEDALAAAVASSPQLSAIRAQSRASAIDVEVTRNGLLPQLDLRALGGPRGYDTSFGPALQQLGRFASYDVQVGVVLSEPVENRAAHGESEAAEAGLRKVRMTEADITGQVRATVMRQVGLMDAARRRIGVLSETVDAATLDLAAERAKFEVGRATNFDVLRRQDDLAQARSRALRARVDYLRAAAGLETVTGDILRHYGVSVR